MTMNAWKIHFLCFYFIYRVLDHFMQKRTSKTKDPFPCAYFLICLRTAKLISKQNLARGPLPENELSMPLFTFMAPSPYALKVPVYHHYSFLHQSYYIPPYNKPLTSKSIQKRYFSVFSNIFTPTRFPQTLAFMTCEPMILINSI